MKLSNSFKKTVAAVVSSAIFLESNASAGWLMNNALLNVSPSGSYTETDDQGRTLNRYYYTTSVYFRFGPAFQYPEPIFQISPPKVSFGCGGLSIKGMFVQILGLDRLEMMLKNAGASLAWGIAIGLIYSLPGVATSFSFLNNWAKKIQQLLANACQSGKNIGKYIGERIPGVDALNTVADNIGSFGDDVVGKMDEMQKTVADFFNADKLFDDNMVFTIGGNKNVDQATQRQVFQNSFIDHIAFPSVTGIPVLKVFKKVQAGSNDFNKFIKQIFGKDVNAVEYFDFRVIEIGYDGQTGNVSAQGSQTSYYFTANDFVKKLLPNLSDDQRFALVADFFFAGLAYNLVGDLVASDESALNDGLKALAKSYKGTATKEELAKVQKTIYGEKAIVSALSSGPKVTEKSLGSNLAKYLYYGIHQNQNGVDNLSKAVVNSLQSLQSLKYAIIALPSQDGTKVDERNFVVIPVGGSHARSFFNTINGCSVGAIDASKYIVKKYLGYGGISSGQNGQGCDTSKDPLCYDICSMSGTDVENSVAFIVPGFKDKIRILQATPEFKRKSMALLLAKFNAYKLTDAMIGGYFGYSGEMFQNVSVPVVNTKNGVPTQSSYVRTEKNKGRNTAYDMKINKIQDVLSDTYKQAKMTLDKEIVSSKEEKDASALEEVFHRLDLENKARAVKTINGQK